MGAVEVLLAFLDSARASLLYRARSPLQTSRFSNLCHHRNRLSPLLRGG